MLREYIRSLDIHKSRWHEERVALGDLPGQRRPVEQGGKSIARLVIGWLWFYLGYFSRGWGR